MADRTDVDLNEAVKLRSELLDSGMTDAQIRRMLKVGQLERIRHGAYIDAGLWADLSATDRHRALVRAVLKRAHPATVATHASAAVERGLPTWGLSLEEVHTTRTDGRTGRREAGVVHHRGVLPEDQVDVVDGVRISSAPRCAVEMMTCTSIESALVTINALLHEGFATKDEVADMAVACKHWPETVVAPLVLQLCDSRLESPGETRAWFMFWQQGLLRPIPQWVVRDEMGREFARLDFAWPELGVFLEFDGREKYLRFRRKNETLEQFLMREKAREERVSQLTGWTCIRISWADLGNPRVLAERIRRILESRRAISA